MKAIGFKKSLPISEMDSFIEFETEIILSVIFPKNEELEK
jgi:hypothetical protein